MTTNQERPFLEAPEASAVRMSPEVGHIAGALAKFQALMEPIARDRTVAVPMKAGGQYTFTYAPLDSIVSQARDPLAANGLSVLQFLDAPTPRRVTVTTLILHETGEWIEATLSGVPVGKDDAQGTGGAFTYARRYAYTAALGLVSEEDDDGARAVRSSGKKESTIPHAVEQMVDVFETEGVTREMLERYLGKPVEKVGQSDLDDMRAIYREVRGKPEACEELFGPGPKGEMAAALEGEEVAS